MDDRRHHNSTTRVENPALHLVVADGNYQSQAKVQTIGESSTTTLVQTPPSASHSSIGSTLPPWLSNENENENENDRAMENSDSNAIATDDDMPWCRKEPSSNGEPQRSVAQRTSRLTTSTNVIAAENSTITGVEGLEFDVEPDEWQKERERKYRKIQWQRRYRNFLNDVRTLCYVVSLFVVACSIFPKQTRQLTDVLSGRNAYASVPLLELVQPLTRGSAERSAYLSAIRFGIQGVADAVGWREGSAEKDFANALAEMEKIPAKRLPLKAYMQAAMAGLEANAGRSATKDLLLAEKLVAESLGPKNFMLALTERTAADYLSKQKKDPESLRESLELANRALAVDLAGAEGNSSLLVIEDELLLARITEKLKDYDAADRVWSNLEQHCALPENKGSVETAVILTRNALYKMRTKHLQESAQSANKAICILKSQSLGVRWMTPWFNRGIHQCTGLLRQYLQECRKLSPKELSAEFEHTSLEQYCYGLENQLLDIFKQMKGSMAQYDELVDLADQYSECGRFQHADRLYKQALLSGQALSRVRYTKFRQDSFTLCMAKTACNSLKAGNVHEASIIAANCLELASPYNSWFPPYRYVTRTPPRFSYLDRHGHQRWWERAKRRQGDISNFRELDLGLGADSSDSEENPRKVQERRQGYTSTFQELVLGFGGDTSNSKEVKEIVNRLKQVLETDYDAIYLPLLAQLEELQGNDRAAELHYKEFAKSSSGTILALAAFYDSTGRHELAREKFEVVKTAQQIRRHIQMMTRGMSGNNQITLAELKLLLDLAPEEKQFEQYSWITKAKLELMKKRTSYQLATTMAEPELEPIYHDCRSTRSRFTDRQFLYVHELRDSIDKLSESQKQNLQQAFPLCFSICTPSIPNSKQDMEILAKCRLLKKFPHDRNQTSEISTPAELIPAHIIVLTSDNAKKLRQLLSAGLSVQP